jgi:NTE family protein
VATVIKNFSYLLLAVSFLFTASCQTLKRRGDQPTPTPRVITPTQNEPVVPEAPQATPVPEDFLHKKTPKVGIILGPGGMRTFAHVGVLKEFARAKIPVEAITGLEWGAMFAGIYAQQGQVNDLEWKALQLKETEIPGKAWLSARVKPESISIMNSYMNNSFGSTLLEKAKIPFSCPTAHLHQDKVSWLARGSMRDAMTKCVPYLPFFTDNNGYLASPFTYFLRVRSFQIDWFLSIMPRMCSGAKFAGSLLEARFLEST